MIRCVLSLDLKPKRRKIKPVVYTRNLPTLSKDDASYWENKFMKAVTASTVVQNQYDKLEIELQELMKQLPREKKQPINYINEETKDLMKTFLPYLQVTSDRLLFYPSRIGMLVRTGHNASDCGDKYDVLLCFLNGVGGGLR
ncbi:unnamed protein product, partial [Brenthis ino]